MLLAAVAVGAIAMAGLLGGAGQPTTDMVVPSPPASFALVAGSLAPSLAPPSAGTGTPGPVGASPAPPDGAASASPSPGPNAPALGVVPAKALQARLDKLTRKLSIPGASVAILWDDGRRWLGASGMRDVAAGDAMTTGTAFALASISKTFTAAVILQLVEEGRLSLDDRVADRLPDFGLDRRITVRMLLDHTSGLPDYFLNPKIDVALQAAKDATWTVTKTWGYVPAKHLKPGKSWLYSNSNYLLLGRLAEVVTGHDLATEIRARLLDPLGLETAWYQADEQPREQGARPYRLVATSGGGVRFVAVAKPSDIMPFRSVVTAAAGAGSIASTALDAARWMRAWAGGDVLTPAMQQTMLADVARTVARKARIPYGLGIQALPVLGRPALGHSGRFLGFRNVVRYLPGEGVTIAVLTNQNMKDPTRIAEGLLKLVLPPVKGPAATASSSP